jgi:hypothetical protein
MDTTTPPLSPVVMKREERADIVGCHILLTTTLGYVEPISLRIINSELISWQII